MLAPSTVKNLRCLERKKKAQYELITTSIDHTKMGKADSKSVHLDVSKSQPAARLLIYTLLTHQAAAVMTAVEAVVTAAAMAAGTVRFAAPAAVATPTHT